QATDPTSALGAWLRRLAPRNGKLTLQIVSHNDDTTSPRPNTMVQIFGSDRVAFRGETDAQGFVTVDGITPGVYALVASAEEQFGYQALHVAQPSSEHVLPSVGIVSCGNVSKSDFESAIAGYLPLEKHLASVELPPSAMLSQHAKSGMSAIRCEQGTMTGHIYAPSVRRDAKTTEFTPARYANVFLYQDGRRVDHKVTATDGGFQFQHLVPGNYTVVTVGPDGLGAVGIELVADSPKVASTANGRLVNQVAFASDFAMQVIPCCHAIATPIPCCEPLVSCCEQVLQTELEPVALETPGEGIVASASPPIGGGPVGGGPSGGAGIQGGFLASPVVPSAVAILAAASDNRDAPWQPPSAASPDTQP
ncbi:MAG: hypothetical protein AAFU85_34560, partial [Planctomycetota bacterium]